MILRLREQGFDATSKNSLIPVGLTENEVNPSLLNVTLLQKEMVFLPLYSEIPFSELNKMVKCLEEFQITNSQSLHKLPMAI